MKSCPNCHRTYTDPTISFCLDDGALLSASANAQPTQPYPQSRLTEAPPTQVLPSMPPPPAAIVTPPSVAAADNRPIYGPPASSKRWLWIAGAIILFLGAGVVLAVIGGIWMHNRDDPSQQTSAGPSPEAASPAPGWSRSPENFGNSAAEVTPPPPPEPKLEMSGIWIGTFDEYSARLTITEHSGNSFVGDLSGETFEVIVEGELDPVTRAITFKETRVIRDKTWVLGTNAGTMSADGQRISGKGTASGSYSWSFKRK